MTIEHGSYPVDIQKINLPMVVVHDKFIDLLESHRGERHIIVLHAYPDPDAIASAYAHRLLSAYFGIKTDIVYTGSLSHGQNIALARLLKLDLIAYERTFDLSQYAGAIFVDNQGPNAGPLSEALQEAKVPVLAVIDHHEIQNYLEPVFTDIRRVGAVATIYAEYLECGPLQLNKSNREHMLVATALMHGIMTDTNNFTVAQPEDFHAASFLSQISDPDLLSQIMSQSRSKDTMEIIRCALEARQIVANFVFAGVGYLRSENRDAIPQTADFLLSEENIHTSIVYGIVIQEGGEETLIGSLRTSKLTLDPDLFIKEIFGKDSTGRPYGGGKPTAGGFQIPVGFLAGRGQENYAELKWQIYDAQVRHKILNKIEGEKDKR